MTEELRADVTPKYPSNPLTAFENGCNLDLRLKLAVEFIKGGAIGAEAAMDDPERSLAAARWMAHFALDIAGELLDEAARRGLVHLLPDHGELNAPTRHFIERNARAQAYAQHVAARQMREDSGQVAAVGGSVMPPSWRG